MKRLLTQFWRWFTNACMRCGDRNFDRWPVGFADWQDRCKTCGWTRDV